MKLQVIGFGMLIALGMNGTAFADEKPEVFVQTGHTGISNSFAFSPDSNLLVSVQGGGSMKLWDVRTRREIRTFKGNNWVAAFSPNGRWIVSGGYKTLKLWDVATGTEVRTFTGHNSYVESVAWTRDGQRIVSGSLDGTVKLWDIGTGKLVRTVLSQAGEIRSVALSPNDQWVMPVIVGGPLKLWDVRTGELVRTFSDKDSAGMSAAFSLDGRWVVTGHYESVKLWEVATGRAVRTFDDRHWNAAVTSVAFSPDGRWIISSGSDKSVKLGEVSTGKAVRILEEGQEYDEETGAVFSPNGKWAVTSISDGSIKLWDWRIGKIMGIFTGSTSKVYKVAFSSDTKRVFAAKQNGSIDIWNISTGEKDRTLTGIKNRIVDWSLDRHWVLAERKDLTNAQLLELETGRVIREFRGDDMQLLAGAFSPENNKILLGTNDATLTLWDVEAENPVWAVKLGDRGNDAIRRVKFSPDGQSAFSVLCTKKSEMVLTRWDVAKGEQVYSLHLPTPSPVETPTVHCDHIAGAMDFSINDRWIVVEGYGGSIKILDTLTGEQIGSYLVASNEGISQLRFSPDGQWVLAVCSDDAVKLLNVATGKVVQTFLDPNWSWVFSSDGHMVVSGGPDGSVQLGNALSGHELVSLVGFNDGEWVGITPKGYYFGSKGEGQHLNVRIGNNVYGIDNFFEQFYRPDVVAEVLRSGESDTTVLARLGEKERVNLTQAVKLPPSVRIVSPKAGESFDSDEAEVQVQAADQGGGVDEILLYHNGKVVGGDTRDLKVTSKAPAGGVAKAYRVRLVDGANVFRAVALSKDRIESNPDELTIQLKAVGKPAILHLLLIGINEYKNSALNLNYALPDAQGMLKFFTGGSSTLFKEIKRYELYDKAATKTAIVSKLKELEATAPQDVVVIYLAGHGESLENTWYFIPWEVATPEREGVIQTQGISSVELKDEIAKIGAQKVLVLIDACKSGAAMVAFAGRGVEDRKALAQLARSTGVHVMAASTKDQLAAEVKDLGHGVFTYTILEGLSGKADGSPKDGRVTVRELLSYVESHLPEISEKYKQQAQYPVVDSRGQDFPLATVR